MNMKSRREKVKKKCGAPEKTREIYNPTRVKQAEGPIPIKKMKRKEQ